MTSKSVLLAAALFTVAPVIGAVAQSNNPQGSQMPSASEPSSSTTTSKPYGSAATNPNQPGATGRTVVPGSTSSMAGANDMGPHPKSGAAGSSDGSTSR